MLALTVPTSRVEVGCSAFIAKTRPRFVEVSIGFGSLFLGGFSWLGEELETPDVSEGSCGLDLNGFHVWRLIPFGGSCLVVRRLRFLGVKRGFQREVLLPWGGLVNGLVLVRTLSRFSLDARARGRIMVSAGTALSTWSHP